METKFTTNREKLSDQEIESRKDFEALVKKFKEQSIENAKVSNRLPKLRKLVYTSIIAGILVVCTVSINEFTKDNTNDKIATNVNLSKNIIEEKASSAFIKPIVKHITSDYSKYKVNASKGGVIKHTTQSKITIPKSAFVKKDGKEITGDIEIHYKEMHTITDALVSGIPMRYDSAGVKQNFESAGMIDIKGFQNGEEVFIKPGKNLDVDMVSTKTGSQFNLYYLDTVSRQWVYKGKDKVVDLETHKNTPAPASTEVSKEVTIITEKIVDLDKKVISVTEVKDNKISSLVSPKEPQQPVASNKTRKQFVLDVDYKQYPELKSFDGCVFEVGEENTHYTSDFNKIQWSDAVISNGTQKGKNYTLNLTSGYRKEKLIVYPVFAGKKLEEMQALYASKLKDYNVALDTRKEKEKKYQDEFKNELKKIEEERKNWVAKLEAEKNRKKDDAINELVGSVKNNSSDLDVKVRRLYQVNNFGVYNSDCAKPFPQGVTTDAVFVTANSILRPANVFLISYADNMMYTYTLEDAENFKYNPINSYCLVTSLHNVLYVCDKAAFSSATKTNDKTTFTFTAMPMDVADSEELRKKLGV